MAVVSAVIPSTNEARLAVRALSLGTEVEVIDSEDGQTYVDLSGTTEKCLLALLGNGATVLDVINYTPSDDPADNKHGQCGQRGEGVPNHGESVYAKTARLMGRPKF